MTCGTFLPLEEQCLFRKANQASTSRPRDSAVTKKEYSNKCCTQSYVPASMQPYVDSTGSQDFLFQSNLHGLQTAKKEMMRMI